MPEARALISAPLLRELLELPEDVEIIGDDPNGNVVLTFRSDRIPEELDGGWVLPTWVKTRVDGKDVVEFKEFGKGVAPYNFEDQTFYGGWRAALEAASKLADTHRNVRVYCDYLPQMILNIQPLRRFGDFQLPAGGTIIYAEEPEDNGFVHDD